MGDVESFLRDINETLRNLDVVDAHLHVGGWRSFSGEAADGLDVSPTEGSRRSEMLSRFGIKSSILMPSVHHSWSREDVRTANNAVASETSGSSTTSYGLFGVGLNDLEDSLEELERCSGMGLRGMTFHHRFAGKIIDHAMMWPLVEAAQARDLPIFVHCLAESTLEALWRLEKLVSAFPQAVFIACDALSSPSSAQHSLEVGRRYPNLFFDTAVFCPIPSIVESFVKKLGSERLIYGSDLYVDPPTYHFPGPLFEIVASPLSDSAKEAILGENARSLLKLE